MRWGTTHHHHPETEEAVTVVWAIGVPVGGAGEVLKAEPRTAAQHAPVIATVHFINFWSVSLIATPFPDVAAEII
jgi:hypothetical protein